MTLPVNYTFTPSFLEACIDKTVSPNLVTHFIVGGWYERTDAPAGSKNTLYAAGDKDSSIAVGTPFDVAELNDPARDAEKNTAIQDFRDEVVKVDNSDPQNPVDVTRDDDAVAVIDAQVDSFTAVEFQRADLPA